MSDGRFAILDPAAGIGGDILLGALVAPVPPADWLLGVPRRLGLPDVRIAIEQVDRGGLRATKVNVLAGGEQEAPSQLIHEPHSHPHSHDHHHAPHRHVGELIEILERAPLSEWVRSRAVRAFRLLGEAEGRIHGVPADQVALHEVGAMDALVDVVAGIEGFERLGIERIHHRPVAVGSGWVRAAHGAIPVPAPATAVLLEGLEVVTGGPVIGEATTPTGAALLRVLSSGPPPARWRVVGAGAWGAGGRNPEGYPNALRLMLAEPAPEAGNVVVLSTDIDDLSPEYLEPLRTALFEAGALDVQMWATQMKKGRIGFRVETVVPPAEADRVSQALVLHSTTAGVRRQTMERYTLPRREIEVEVGEGINVRVKVLDAPDGPRVKPEFDDVAEVARRTGRPAHEVARDLHQRALRLVGSDGATQVVTPNKES
jgi:pyridinium-3,5-bisthiocarboxylic acid mononucleotide nickel chelatase